MCFGTKYSNPGAPELLARLGASTDVNSRNDEGRGTFALFLLSGEDGGERLRALLADGASTDGASEMWHDSEGVMDGKDDSGVLAATSIQETSCLAEEALLAGASLRACGTAGC